jgi:iron complex outermembrane receptor protein
MNITKYRLNSRVVTSATALFLFTTGPSALAQESAALEEIIVTAQYREQSVQDVPIAMSAFSGDELENAGVTDLTNLSRLAPDFVAINDLGFVRLSVRGVQSNSNDEGGDQALVFNIDGDYINRGNFINSAMFDLERVEVLRGPQGTLYGRNATGGAVNAIARKPSVDGIEGTVSADFGDYSSQIINGAVNVPLGGIAAVRVAAMLAEHDGYSSHPNFDEDTNDQDTEAYRIGLLVEPTDALSLYLAAEHAEEVLVPSYAGANANFPPFQADAPAPGTCSSPGWETVATFNPGFGCAPYRTQYLENEVPRDDYLILSPWLGGRDQETTSIRGSVEYDADTFGVIYRFAFRESEWTGASPVPNLMFYRAEETDNSSHELRFSGGGDGGLFWQAGLFYYSEDIDGRGGLHLPFGQQADPTGVGIYLNTFYRPNFESESTAAFGQVEIPFSDVFTAVVGARYTQDDKSGTFYNFAGPPAVAPGGLDFLRPIEEANVVFPASFDNNETTWTVGINYEPNDDSLHYAKVSKGYKAGGFDAVGTYAPETNIAYEIGSKNQFEKSTLNATAFYYDYTDLQASVLLDTSVGGQIFNAGAADIWGLEAQYELFVADNGRLKLSANYLSAEYTEFSPLEEAIQCVGGCDANTTVSDASGNTLPNAPEWIFTVGYDHAWELAGAGTITGSIFSRYKDDYFNTVFNYADDRQDGYTQTDVSLEYLSDSGMWSVLAYVRNLEDERPINYFNFISAGPSNDDFNWGFGAPRTYGIRLAIDF